MRGLMLAPTPRTQGTRTERGFGDMGLCTNTCNCQADCPTGLDCTLLPAEAQVFTVRPGLCRFAVDCSESPDPNCVDDTILTECF